MDQAEQLRNVIKMRNQNNAHTARVITITSGKGGVGKSNTAVNLAVWLRKAGKRVIIFDADFGLANIEVMFGAIPKFNLSDMIYNGKSMKDIITTGPMGIGFISGGSGVLALNNLYHDQILYLVKGLNELNDLADYIIIDTGAGISDQVLEFVMTSPEVLLVTTPEPSSLTDSYSLMKALYRNPNFVTSSTTIGLIANKVTSKEEGQNVYDKLESVVDQFLHGHLEYIGMIPQDMVLEKAVRQQKIVSISDPNSMAAKSYKAIADNLMNGGNQPVQIRWGISQLVTNILTRTK